MHAINQLDRIEDVLNMYFECNIRNGKKNPDYDELMSAQDCIDRIVEIVKE